MNRYTMKGTVIYHTRADSEEEAITKFEEQARRNSLYLIVDSKLSVVVE